MAKQPTIGYIPVKLTTIPVRFSNGPDGIARATGNNASWMCRCGDSLPLIGTLFPEKRSTKCPSCGSTFVLREGLTSVDQVTTL
jgi:rRNA maturation endonuclease Nob1